MYIQVMLINYKLLPLCEYPRKMEIYKYKLLVRLFTWNDVTGIVKYGFCFIVGCSQCSKHFESCYRENFIMKQ